VISAMCASAIRMTFRQKDFTLSHRGSVNRPRRERVRC
jgi:hypothetical protein